MRLSSIAVSSLHRSFRLAVLAVVPWFLCTYAASHDAVAGPVRAPVVGGHPVQHGEWPDVVAVLTGDGGYCSGTLLGADLVVTAAHCIEAVPTEVVIGSIDLAEPDGQRRRVKWSRAYPSWTERYDVGVVMLENPVLARERAVAQGCTANERIVGGARLEVVGFGLTSPSGTDSNTQLRAATIEVTDPTCTSDAACEPSVAPAGEFIAGGHGTDACFGDSGGPVYIETAEGPALVGIVSRGLATFGEPCGEGGVFVRADKVVSWIQSVSGRKVDRVPCDLPADAPAIAEAGGCAATPGLLGAGWAVYYALVCIAVMRGSRRRGAARRATTRSPWPRSR